MMSAAGPALSRPEFPTFHANGGVNTDMVGAALRLARKAAGLSTLFALAGVRVELHDTLRCSSSGRPPSNPRISFETARRPVFCGRVSGKNHRYFSFGDQNSTNAENTSSLTDVR